MVLKVKLLPKDLINHDIFEQILRNIFRDFMDLKILFSLINESKTIILNMLVLEFNKVPSFIRFYLIFNAFTNNLKIAFILLISNRNRVFGLYLEKRLEFQRHQLRMCE